MVESRPSNSNYLLSMTKMEVFRLVQVALVVLMSCALGSLMQLVKLSSVDAAARQYSQTSHFVKQSFLTSYGVFKAAANLALGWWVSSPADVKWGGLGGWLLGLGVPLLAAVAQNWATVVVANAVLGFQQGLAWTCTVLLIVPLFHVDQRGLALGLNEAMGYMCLAAMAPIYGQLERWMVNCNWVTESASPECLSACEGCDDLDGWVPECVGQCVCGSYTGLVARVGGIIVSIGLGLCVLLILLQLYGPVIDLGANSEGCNSGTKALGNAGGRYSVVDKYERGLGARKEAGEVELELAEEQEGSGAGVRGGALGGGVIMKAAGGQGGWEGEPSMPNEADVTSPLSIRSDGTVDDGSAYRYANADQGLPMALEPPVSKAAAFACFTLGLGYEGSRGPAAAQDSSSDGGLRVRGQRRAGWLPRWWQPVEASCRGVGLQGDGEGVGLQGSGVSGGLGTSSTAGKGGRSTLILCCAGMACNCVASLAWGMLLSWARDLLLIPGPSRDLMASSYQFVMAASLLLAAHTSDQTGRRWWMVGGLCCNAAGLLTAACGAGFNGKLLLGVVSAPAGLAAGDAEQQSLQLLQYGYLQLASCLLGLGTGSMYGTMAAAVVDHSTPGTQTINMATFRFWRDLGYALGSLAGLVADGSSTEVAMLSFGALSLVIATWVTFCYMESGREPTAPPGLPSLDAVLSESENDEEVQRQSLLNSRPAPRLSMS